MLDVERAAAGRCSTSRPCANANANATANTLTVKRPGSDESREVNVDLLETFNWLIGLPATQIAAAQTGRLMQEAGGGQ